MKKIIFITAMLCSFAVISLAAAPASFLLFKVNYANTLNASTDPIIFESVTENFFVFYSDCAG